jgi:hypothetical protein
MQLVQGEDKSLVFSDDKAIFTVDTAHPDVQVPVLRIKEPVSTVVPKTLVPYDPSAFFCADGQSVFA